MEAPLNPDFLTLQPIIEAARTRLDQAAWDYLVGGSESETTLRRNRDALDRIAFRPRVLIDVSRIDTSASLLGQALRIPVITAPVGSLQLFTANGGLDIARAAAEFGMVPVISAATEPSLEEIAAATDDPKLFQLYVRGDRAWIRDLVVRAKEAGYKAVVVTVDAAVVARRERPLLSTGAVSLSRFFRDPADMINQARLTWDSIEEIRAVSGLPIILKGISTPEDAKRAAERGVDAVWVSNHGGRQLDHGRGIAAVLPEIVAAVDGRASIIADGAVHRGSDIVKLIGLGADAVAIGRLQVWGLAAGGQSGLRRVLEILEAEMVSTMGLLGVTRLEQLGPQHLAPAQPVTPAHEMSSWVNMPTPGGPGGRLL